MEATNLLRNLYEAHSDDVAALYRWSDEEDRWYEFAFAVLDVTTDCNRSQLRRIVGALNDLNFLDPGILDSVKRVDGVIDQTDPTFQMLSQTLVYNGVTEEQAATGLSALVAASAALRKDHNGRLQALVRQYTAQLVADLEALLESSEISSDHRTRIAKLWLQNAFEWPVLESVGYVDDYCEQHGVTLDELRSAADDLNVNLSVVDDLIDLAMTDLVA